jgi:hypothetical protein
MTLKHPLFFTSADFKDNQRDYFTPVYKPPLLTSQHKLPLSAFMWAQPLPATSLITREVAGSGTRAIRTPGHYPLKRLAN